MICKKCGKSIPDNARICRYCNTAVSRGAQHSPKAVSSSVKRTQSTGSRQPIQGNARGAQVVRPASNSPRPVGRTTQKHSKPKKNPSQNTVVILLIVCAFLIIIVGAIFMSSLNSGNENENNTETAVTSPKDDVIVITFSKGDENEPTDSTPIVPDVSDTNTTDTLPVDSSAETQTEPPVTGPSGPVLAPPAVSSDPCTYFDDAVFIGDSVSLKLSYYAMNGSLGSPIFLTRGSYSMCHAAWNTMYLNYQGQDMTPEDALAATGAKKVFIMLGMNDIGAYGIDKTIEHWEMVIGRIKEKCPDLEIFIQSCTPICAGGERGSLTNANMDSFNARLKTFAVEHGCHFLDIAPYMKDANGALVSAYCSDGYVHLTDEGVEVWVKVLKDFAVNR